MRCSLALLLIAVLVAGLVMLVVPISLGSDKLPPVLRMEQDGYVYTYHVLSGTEALFDLRLDPRLLKNLAPSMPDRAFEMRRRLSFRYRVADLADLRKKEDPTRRSLEAHGYLR
jgi:hypothetical protein